MFRIRQSYREDAEQILAVAEHLDTVNLPADKAHIEAILDHSEKSFSEELPEREREYVFVLEDQSAKRVIGTSMIHAQHGTKRAPHVFFRVEQDERYSYTLDRYFVHQTLRIGYNYNGPTEIGGLILLPEYRRSSEALGKSLSYMRFLFIAMHRPVFRDKVLSELLPPLGPDGQSPLWEHLGRHFTGLDYHTADLLSKENKEFIHALFPHDPIHTELLPAEVRAQIGVVGPDTRGVEKILRRIGFDYADQIDPFDGGPHFTAVTDEITLVRGARQVTVTAVDDAADSVPSSAEAGLVPAVGGERPWAVMACERPGQRPGFRGTGARVVPMDDGSVGVTAETRRRLGVEAGEVVWMALG